VPDKPLLELRSELRLPVRRPISQCVEEPHHLLSPERAATGRLAAAFLGKNPCNRTLRGANLSRWRRSRAQEAAHLGKTG
jgi:hypothetical protein